MNEKKTSQEILPVQKWLEENCKPDDWDRLEEGLKDGLWTNNVLDYMKDYADYVSEQRVKELEAENEWISVEDRLPNGYNELRTTEMDVIGYNSKWIDADFNPNGTRICVYCEAWEDKWVSMRWNGSHDCYIEDRSEAPMHWKPMPNAPKV